MATSVDGSASHPPTKGWVARVLAIAGDDGPAALHRSQLEWLRLAMLATVTFELTHYAAFRRVHGVVDVAGAFDVQPTPPWVLAMPLALALSLLAIVLGRERSWHRFGGTAAALTMATITFAVLPNTPNHYPLVMLTFGLLALFDGRDEKEAAVAVQAVRWLFAIALVLSGLQKTLYGAYFHGEFFAYRIAIDPIFATPFEWIMPAEEVARLRGLGGLDEGAGPFRTSWWPLAVLANLSWIFEMALPVFLLWRRTRPWAIAVTLLFFVGIEVAPRELFFGGIAVQLVLLFGRRDWNRLLMPLWLAALVAATLLRIAVPEVAFW